MKYNEPGYWRDWYWNRGGREKVQYSRKVTQRLFWAQNQQKHKENELKRNGTKGSNQEQ